MHKNMETNSFFFSKPNATFDWSASSPVFRSEISSKEKKNCSDFLPRTPLKVAKTNDKKKLNPETVAGWAGRSRDLR